MNCWSYLRKPQTLAILRRSDFQRQFAVLELAAVDGVGIECVHRRGRGMLFQVFG